MHYSRQDKGLNLLLCHRRECFYSQRQSIGFTKRLRIARPSNGSRQFLADLASHRRTIRPPMRLKLHHLIFLAMIVGAVAGIFANELASRGPAGAANPTLTWIVQNIAEPIGQIFLRMIFMVAIPLVFAALALGVAGMGDLRKLGRVGIKTPPGDCENHPRANRPDLPPDDLADWLGDVLHNP